MLQDPPPRSLEDEKQEWMMQRLRSLEEETQSLQSFRSGLIVILLFSALVTGYLWLTREAIYARRLILTNPNEKIRAELSVGTAGLLNLTLVDAAGSHHGALVLGALDNMLALTLHGKGGGRIPVYLGREADGSNHLDLYDMNGNVRAQLGVLADGTPRLRLYDRDGKITWSAP